LVENQRGVVLAARLGVIDLVDRMGLRGNLFLTGPATDGHLTEVPEAVLEAAHRAGLLPDDGDNPALHVTGHDGGTATVHPDEGALSWSQVLPRRPSTDLTGCTGFESEDPQIMTRVLAGLLDEREPQPMPGLGWEPASWWGT